MNFEDDYLKHKNENLYTKVSLLDYINLKYNQINENKRYLKYFAFILFASNIILFIFIITFNYTISSVRNTNNAVDNQLKEIKLSRSIKQGKINHLLVNLINKKDRSGSMLTNIIKSKEEYNKIMGLLPLKTMPNVYFCYQASSMNENLKYFINHCLTYRALILMRTQNGRRFGAYIGKRQYLFHLDEFVDDQTAFLFNLDNNKTFLVQNSQQAYIIYKDGYFMFGNEDLIIKPNFLNESTCLSKFPSNYGNKSDSYEDLTGEKFNFRLSEFEVYSLLLF